MTAIAVTPVALELANDWPSAIEFVNSAAARMRADKHRSQSQDELIRDLSAQLVSERARSDGLLADLEADIRRLQGDQLRTLERLEASLLECSLLRLAFRQVVEDALAAEQDIRQSTDQIFDLKRRLVSE